MPTPPIDRRVIVNSGFQYRLLAGSLLYLLSVVLAFLVALFAPAMTALADDALSFGERNEAARDLLALHDHVWLALPLLVALCIFHSILISHRIAGPLVRFRQVLTSLAGGDLSRSVSVSLRKNDYLADEAALLETTVRNTRSRLQAIESEYARVSATLPQLMDALAGSGDTETKVLAGRLGAELDGLGARLREFQLTNAASPSPESAARSASEMPVG